MFSHRHQTPPTQHVSQCSPCLHRLVSVAFVPRSFPRRRLSSRRSFHLSTFASIVFRFAHLCWPSPPNARHSRRLLLAPTCRTRPCETRAPAQDQALQEMQSLPFIGSFLLVFPVPLIHYSSDNEHRRSFRLRSSCSALETHSIPSSKLITERLHTTPCHV